MSRGEPGAIFHRRGWLAAQPEPFRNAWMEISELRSVSRGDRLYSLGDPPGGVYGIAEGFADVMTASGYEPPVLAHIARPGWWVGEAAAVTGSPRRVEIRARTDLRVCYVSLRRLEELEEVFPIIWRLLAQMTVLHLDNALMYAASLLKGDARTKLVSTLVRLAGPEMLYEADISIPCSQQDLGEMSGLSRNSIGPAFRALEGDGLIRRGAYGSITYNPIQLSRMMEAGLSRGSR
ncbi:Crp/Fnr family transcriptional regulator [Albibacillus kandeliae]|uniref:Crp/Fnr family transcriptional regulator n=1 Tax=Albibacillus kandeliae TaxID=2174228 RepID=UPI0018E53717|nr:Crp/Fnr family transcriptional regulator [Albibacillus kandeliae]